MAAESMDYGEARQFDEIHRFRAARRLVGASMRECAMFGLAALTAPLVRRAALGRRRLDNIQRFQ